MKILNVKWILPIAILLLTSCGSYNLIPEYKYNQHLDSYKPINGYVPDKKTAIKIAEAIWLTLYGKDIYNTIPFQAELLGDTLWVVAGTLPPKRVGGTPYIEIQKSDAKVLKVMYTK